MNSSYGKTIQKPFDFDLKFLTKWQKDDKPSKYERFYRKNYHIEVPFENDDYAISLTENLFLSSLILVLMV